MKPMEVKKQSEQESTKIIEAFGRETEQVFARAYETARKAAELELEKALHEYEQKAKQIVLKIREDAKVRTAEIASRLSEAILQGIERSSAEAVASSVIDFNKRAENLTQNLCQTGAKQQAQAEPEKPASGAGDSLEIDVAKDLAGVADDKPNGRAQANEEFEQWLKQ
jgi:hypothetical protein